ncbi:hypothetical protein JXJ21_13025 [candidate division KSB1 bacterium]|nr:hypothetical protein [candidate division KSB1 bacterium]
MILLLNWVMRSILPCGRQNLVSRFFIYASSGFSLVLQDVIRIERFKIQGSGLMSFSEENLKAVCLVGEFYSINEEQSPEYWEPIDRLQPLNREHCT